MIGYPWFPQDPVRTLVGFSSSGVNSSPVGSGEKPSRKGGVTASSDTLLAKVSGGASSLERVISGRPHIKDDCIPANFVSSSSSSVNTSLVGFVEKPSPKGMSPIGKKGRRPTSKE